MYVMYIVSFLLVLFFLAMPGNSVQTERSESRAQAYAAQMTLWHATAHKICAAPPGCGNGTISPDVVKSRLPAEVRIAPAVSTTDFATRFHSATGTLVTYMDPSLEREFGLTATSLRDLTNGETSSVGIWDRTSMKVWFASRSKTDEASKSFPFATFIPDRSPVIFSFP